LEITLNHPRTPKFCNMTSDEQRKHYDKLFDKIKTYLPEPLCEQHISRVFEYCKTGHVHLHACIDYKLKDIHFPMGLVADVCKRFLTTIKQVFQERYCYPEYNRYRSPSIVCQYFQDDIKRREVWIEYMYKMDYNKKTHV